MSRLLGWSPQWYQPGESLWSVANKLAFATCASVADVLRILAGVLDRCREAWLFPGADQAVTVCEELGLPLKTAKGQLFADVRGVPELREREHWQLGIRYCLPCLQGFAHRTIFQDLRVTHCPVHRVRLLAGCPVCKTALDPACDEPWSCSHCGAQLVWPSKEWTRRFREGPVLAACPDTSPPPAAVHPLDMPDPMLRRWVAEIAYEEHAAIWSTLLGTHEACVQKDVDVLNVDRMPTRFTCPVAGAAWMSAKTMGIRPQFSSGAWVVKNPSAATELANATYLVGRLPADKVDRAVRALVRQWTLELLDAFVAAAQAGHTFADWSGGSLRLPRNRAGVYDRLGVLAAEGGSRCGFTGGVSTPNL